MCQAAIDVIAISGTWTGLNGASRSAAASYTYRGGGTNYVQTVSSTALSTGSSFVFTRNASDPGTPTATMFNGRLAFYSIGESLDLARLDTRVTDLMNAIGAALP